MKRLALAALAVLAILSAAEMSAYAAPLAAPTVGVGPYEGTFRGTAYGDKGSSAPLWLDLTHRGTQVTGKAYLGEGLHVSAGFCGSVNLPAAVQRIEGETAFWNTKRLAADPTFEAGGLDLTVEFESDVSADGEVITAKAKVDLPWFCGHDPVLTSTLYKD